ncbi:MAG: hypothetical protein M3O02_06000, partial [Acidobacteriota bacterium]|nr:hypothetical protein [Acidobacteriota bacterium]
TLAAGSGTGLAAESGTSPAALASVRVDRTFRAACPPGGMGHECPQECLWIIDYKTAGPGARDREAFLDAERLAYAPQLENYAVILARSQGMPLACVRVGLYYPALPKLIWWTPEGGGASRPASDLPAPEG